MKKSILIVDDEPSDLKTMETILEKKGYTTTSVKNGAEALNELKKKHFDLMLLDILLPNLSGYDLLRLLKERPEHHVKIFYVSILPKRDVNMEGVDGFVQKPFSPDALLAEVEKALK